MYNFIKENRFKVLVIPLFIYWIILFIGTTMPSPQYVDVFEISDKIKHFTAYFTLAFLLGMNLYFQEKWKALSKYFLSYTFIICVTYGLLDEIHQIFVPNRTCEFYDWLADLSGSLLAVLLLRFTVKILLKSKNINETIK